MSRIRWISRRIIVASCAAAAMACAPARVAPDAAPAPPEDELPPGGGRAILVASCTSCHDLREVTKFRGYYDRAQWRDVVVTMVEYGAEVRPEDVEVLADYLVEHLGRR